MFPTLLLAGGLALSASVFAGDWENPPLYVVSEKVELIVGREVTVVSGRLVYQYVKADDTERLPQVYFHFPVYVKQESTDWREAQAAAGFELQIGGRAFKPVSGSIVAADTISDYPVPEDAAVVFLTYAVPRNLAEQGFEVTVQYVQPNFTYLGGRMALHTPWMPRSMRQHPYLALADNVFELRLSAGRDVTLQRVPSEVAVVAESPTEITAVPAHRQTVAVTLQ